MYEVIIQSTVAFAKKLIDAFTFCFAFAQHFITDLIHQLQTSLFEIDPQMLKHNNVINVLSLASTSHFTIPSGQQAKSWFLKCGLGP